MYTIDPWAQAIMDTVKPAYPNIANTVLNVHTPIQLDTALHAINLLECAGYKVEHHYNENREGHSPENTVVWADDTRGIAFDCIDHDNVLLQWFDTKFLH